MDTQDIAAVRAVIDERISAIKARDAARAVATLADDIVAFEMTPPLACPPAAVRDEAATRAWLDGFDGPIHIEVRELGIAAEGDLAFVFALHRLAGARRGAPPVDFWFRSTFCLRRRDDAWKIVHAHSSVPLGPDLSGRLDLAPD